MDTARPTPSRSFPRALARTFFRGLASAQRVNPFNAIFGKELRATARRKRTYVLRFVYLGALLLLLLLAYLSSRSSYGYRSNSAVQQAQRAAELGTSFFFAFSMFCVIAMAIIGPVLTATAISSERLQKTLNVLLMTPITSWQIISGKLLSRMLVALTLLGLSLPVLAVVRLLGSVEIEQMVGVICIALMTALSSAAVGLFFSTFMNRAYAVILLSYATLGFIYLFVPFMMVLLLERRSRGPGPPMWLLNFLEFTNPMFATAGLSSPDMYRFMRATPWWYAIAGQGALVALLVWFSAKALRRIARREHGSAGAAAAPGLPPQSGEAGAPATARLALAPRTNPALPPPMPATVPLTMPPLPPFPALPESAPGAAPAFPPSALPLPYAGRRVAAPRTVGDNPVLWREVRRPLMARRWQAIVGSIACVGLLLFSYGSLAASYRNMIGDSEVQIGYAFVFEALVTLLVCVLSATAIAQEKESDTWTLLLATPVTARAVVWGKLGGILRKLMWPAVLVAAHFFLFAATGVISFSSAALVMWVLFSFNALWIVTGLYLSLRLKKVTFAVILNLLLPVAAYLLVLVLAEIFGEMQHAHDVGVRVVGWYAPYPYLESAIRGFSPARYVGYNSYSRLWLPDHYQRGDSERLAAWLCAVIGAGAIYLALAALLLRATIAGFDRIVGRAPQRLPVAPGAAAGGKVWAPG